MNKDEKKIEENTNQDLDQSKKIIDEYSNIFPIDSQIIEIEDKFTSINSIPKELRDSINLSKLLNIGKDFSQLFNEFSKHLDGTDLFFIPHPELFSAPAKRLSPDNSKFLLMNGSEYIIAEGAKKQIIPTSSEILNLETLKLSEITNKNFSFGLYNACKLYLKGYIYFSTWNVLLAINPYRNLPIYTEDFKKYYKESPNVRLLPPHVFSIVRTAYLNLRSNFKSQIIVIEGEAGSGKTVTSNHCLQQLHYLCGSKIPKDSPIIKSSEILEAFGNSLTRTNHNSTRFIKLIEVHFDAFNTVVGSRFKAFLLEKTRVSIQSKMNRNFHIFYYLCRGASSELKKKLSLDDVVNYEYLTSGGITISDKINDKENFSKIDNNLRSLLGEENTFEIYKVLSAILHIGNIKFSQPNVNKPCKIENPEEIKIISELLGLNEDSIVSALTILSLKDLYKYYTTQKANDVKNAWARLLYSKLFNYLVELLNEKMDLKSNTTKYIGILDNYGFEHFQDNSMEELVINYISEKMQSIFVQNVLNYQQSLYEEEAIAFQKIPYKDNSRIISFFEDKKDGLFTMIEDEIRIPNSSDDKLLGKLNKKYGNSKDIYKYDSRDPRKFSLFHFGKKLNYNIAQFLEKSKDEISVNIKDLILTSSNQFLKIMLSKEENLGNKNQMISGVSIRPSIGIQYYKNLNSMIDGFKDSEIHYIKCVLANQGKKPLPIDPPYILQQLNNNGLAELIEISQRGFLYQIPFSDFQSQFPAIIGNKKELTAEYITNKLNSVPQFSNMKIIIGKNRVFFNHTELINLEECESKEIAKITIKAQGYILRKKAIKLKRKLREADKILKEAIQTEDIEKINQALEQTKDIEFELFTKKVALAKIEEIKKRKEDLAKAEELRQLEKLRQEELKIKQEEEQRKAAQLAEELKIKEEEEQRKAAKLAEELKIKEMEEEQRKAAKLAEELKIKEMEEEQRKAAKLAEELKIKEMEEEQRKAFELAEELKRKEAEEIEKIEKMKLKLEQENQQKELENKLHSDNLAKEEIIQKEIVNEEQKLTEEKKIEEVLHQEVKESSQNLEKSEKDEVVKNSLSESKIETIQPNQETEIQEIPKIQENISEQPKVEDKKELDAEALKMKEEIEKITKILEKSKDNFVPITELQEAIEKGITLNINSELINEAKNALERHHYERNLINTLNDKLNKGEIQETSINGLDKIFYNHLEEFNEELAKVIPKFYVNELKEIPESCQNIIFLRKALKSKDIKEITRAIKLCEENPKLKMLPEIEKSKGFLKYLEEIEQEEDQLKKGIETKNKKIMLYLLEQIKSTKHEINPALLKQSIESTKKMIEIDYIIDEALKNKNDKFISYAIEQLDQYNPKDPRIEELKRIQEEVHLLLVKSSFAIMNMNSTLMEENLKNASDMNCSHSLIELQRVLLYEMDPEDLSSCKMKAAEITGNKKVIVNNAIASNEKKFQSPDSGKKYDLTYFSKLKKPFDWAKASNILGSMFVDESKRFLGFLKWTDVPIHRTLCQKTDKSKNNELKNNFQNIMAFMGDVKHDHPEECGQSVVFLGIGNVEARDEIYVQILKQLRSNPNKHSQTKGILLLSYCLQAFSPQDSWDFVEYHIRNFCEDKIPLLMLMYEKKLLKPNEVMQVSDVRNLFKSAIDLKQVKLANAEEPFDPSFNEIGIHKELLRHINALSRF